MREKAELLPQREWALVLVALAAALTMGSLLVSPSQTLVVVAILLLPIALGVAFRMPGMVFAAYLYIPFYKGAVDPLLPVDLTVLLAAACVLLFLLFMGRARYDGVLEVFSLWTGVLLFVAMGVLYSHDSNVATSHFMYFLLLVFAPLLLGLVIVQDSRFLDQFLLFTIILSIIVTLVGMLQLGQLGQYDRLTGLSNTISTARSALMLPIALPAVLLVAPRWLLLLSVASSPFAIFIAVASGSRGPIVFGIGLLVLSQILGRKGLGKRMLIGGVAVFAMLGLLQSQAIQALLPQQSVLRMSRVVEAMFGGGDLEDLSASRSQLFDLAASMFLERPVLGYGTAGFEIMADTTPTLSFFSYPHNVVLQVAAEFGTIGLTLFLSFVVFAFLRALPYVHEVRIRVLFVLCLFAFLNALVSSDFYDNRWMWGALLMLIAVRRTPPFQLNEKEANASA